jgi:hypothetical protein
MTLLKKKIRRWGRFAFRRFREQKIIAKGLFATGHLVLAHLIPMRRSNLSCTYCNEFDKFALPVPVSGLFKRSDPLSALGTTIVTINRGNNYTPAWINGRPRSADPWRVNFQTLCQDSKGVNQG